MNLSQNGRVKTSLVIDGLILVLIAHFSFKGDFFFPLQLIALPLGLLPLFRYLLSYLIGISPGQSLMRVKWVHKTNRTQLKRLFDWLFEGQWIALPALPVARTLTELVIPVGLLLSTVGVLVFRASQDPSLKAYPIHSIPVFAPTQDEKNQKSDWNILAFFYSHGAWPNQFQKKPVLYSLPYEKGPPERFVGKIQIFWDLPDAKLTLLGPLTLKAPSQASDLKNCFTQARSCVGIRREIFKRQLKFFFELAQLEKAAWFEVAHPHLNEVDTQKPEGVYLSGQKKGSPQTWVEAYYLVNSKMAVQGIILESTQNPTGIAAQETLRKVIGSIRTVSDLSSLRTFVNSQISTIRLTQKSSISELINAQSYLLSKVSVDPKMFESFYHLGGLSMTLFQQAKLTHQVELTAASKQTILSAHLFGQDVDPKNPKLKELELFSAELRKAP